MSTNIYVGISSKARKVKNAYIGIGNKARKIKKVYTGINDIAKNIEMDCKPYKIDKLNISTVYGECSAGHIKGKVLFSGQEPIKTEYYYNKSVVVIDNYSLTLGSNLELYAGCSGTRVASNGNYLFFAGGCTRTPNHSAGNYFRHKTVTMFNSVLGKSQATDLSSASSTYLDTNISRYAGVVYNCGSVLDKYNQSAVKSTIPCSFSGMTYVGTINGGLFYNDDLSIYIDTPTSGMRITKAKSFNSNDVFGNTIQTQYKAEICLSVELSDKVIFHNAGSNSGSNSELFAFNSSMTLNTNLPKLLSDLTYPGHGHVGDTVIFAGGTTGTNADVVSTVQILNPNCVLSTYYKEFIPARFRPGSVSQNVYYPQRVYFIGGHIRTSESYITTVYTF